MFGSKKQKTIDPSKINDGLDFDLGDLDASDEELNRLLGNGRQNGRKPTVATEFIGGASRDFISETVNFGNINDQIIKKILPSDYGTILDRSDAYTTPLTEMYTESVKTIRPAAYRLATTVNRLVPNELKTLKKITSSVTTKLSDDSTYSSSDSPESIRENSIKASLAEVFDVQRQVDQRERAHDRAEGRIKDEINFKNERFNQSVFSAIENNTSRVAQYTTSVNSAFQRKSLEIQYRSFFIQSEMLEHNKKYYELFKSQNESIVRNTGLPDYLKITTPEMVAEAAVRRAVGNVSESLYGEGSVVSRSIKRLNRKVKNFSMDVRDSLESGTTGIQMMEDLREDDESISRTAGRAVGKGLAYSLFGKIGDKLKEFDLLDKLDQHTNGAGKKIRNKMSTLADMLKNPTGYAAKALGRGGSLEEDYSDGTARGIGKSFGRFFADSFKESANTKVTEGQSITDLNRPVPFDVATRKSIVTVIPKYLSHILREVTALRLGKEPELLKFDHKSNDLMRSSQITKNLTRDLDVNIRTSSLRSSYNAFFKYMEQKDNKGKFVVKQENHFTPQEKKSIIETSFILRLRGHFTGIESLVQPGPGRKLFLERLTANGINNKKGFTDVTKKINSIFGVNRQGRRIADKKQLQQRKNFNEVVNSLPETLSKGSSVAGTLSDLGQDDNLIDSGFFKKKKDGSFYLDEDNLARQVGDLEGDVQRKNDYDADTERLKNNPLGMRNRDNIERNDQGIHPGYNGLHGLKSKSDGKARGVFEQMLDSINAMRKIMETCWCMKSVHGKLDEQLSDLNSNKIRDNLDRNKGHQELDSVLLNQKNNSRSESDVLRQDKIRQDKERKGIGRQRKLAKDRDELIKLYEETKNVYVNIDTLSKKVEGVLLRFNQENVNLKIKKPYQIALSKAKSARSSDFLKSFDELKKRIENIDVNAPFSTEIDNLRKAIKLRHKNLTSIHSELDVLVKRSEKVRRSGRRTTTSRDNAEDTPTSIVDQTVPPSPPPPITPTTPTPGSGFAGGSNSVTPLINGFNRVKNKVSNLFTRPTQNNMVQQDLPSMPSGTPIGIDQSTLDRFKDDKEKRERDKKAFSSVNKILTGTAGYGAMSLFGAGTANAGSLGALAFEPTTGLPLLIALGLAGAGYKIYKNKKKQRDIEKAALQTQPGVSDVPANAEGTLQNMSGNTVTGSVVNAAGTVIDGASKLSQNVARGIKDKFKNVVGASKGALNEASKRRDDIKSKISEFSDNNTLHGIDFAADRLISQVAGSISEKARSRVKAALVKTYKSAQSKGGDKLALAAISAVILRTSFTTAGLREVTEWTEDGRPIKSRVKDTVKNIAGNVRTRYRNSETVEQAREGIKNVIENNDRSIIQRGFRLFNRGRESDFIKTLTNKNVNVSEKASNILQLVKNIEMTELLKKLIPKKKKFNDRNNDGHRDNAWDASTGTAASVGLKGVAARAATAILSRPLIAASAGLAVAGIVSWLSNLKPGEFKDIVGETWHGAKKLAKGAVKGAGNLAVATGEVFEQWGLTLGRGIIDAGGWALDKSLDSLPLIGHVYKYMKNKAMEAFNEGRFLQYGIRINDLPSVQRILELEAYIIDERVVDTTNGKVQKDRIDQEKLFKIFDIDKDDVKGQRRFIRWFTGRFIKVFRYHAVALRTIKKEFSDFTLLKSLNKKEKLEYFNRVKSISGILNVFELPFNTDEKNDVTEEEIDAWYRQAIDKVKAQKDDPEKKKKDGTSTNKPEDKVGKEKDDYIKGQNRKKVLDDLEAKRASAEATRRINAEDQKVSKENASRRQAEFNKAASDISSGNVPSPQAPSSVASMTGNTLLALPNTTVPALDKNPNGYEKALEEFAIKNGIQKGPELAAFMANASVETGQFKHLTEKGKNAGSQYEGRKVLGNTEPGDGEKFKGRGFMQLTGRYNYGVIGNALGVDLVNNPDLVSEPEMAMKTAVAYWKLHNGGKIPEAARSGDFKKSVYYVNGGYNAFNERQGQYDKYLQMYNSGNTVAASAQSTPSAQSAPSTPSAQSGAPTFSIGQRPSNDLIMPQTNGTLAMSQSLVPTSVPTVVGNQTVATNTSLVQPSVLKPVAQNTDTTKLPEEVLNLRVKDTDGKVKTLKQLGVTTYDELSKRGGQAFAGGYNDPSVTYATSLIQKELGDNFGRVTAQNDHYHKVNAPSSEHTKGYKTDYTVNDKDYKKAHADTVAAMTKYGLVEGKDFKIISAPHGTGGHIDFKLTESGRTKMRTLMGNQEAQPQPQTTQEAGMTPAQPALPITQVPSLGQAVPQAPVSNAQNNGASLPNTVGNATTPGMGGFRPPMYVPQPNVATQSQQVMPSFEPMQKAVSEMTGVAREQLGVLQQIREGISQLGDKLGSQDVMSQEPKQTPVKQSRPAEMPKPAISVSNSI